MSRRYHIGDRVLITNAWGVCGWEGVVVQTASGGTRVKVLPDNRPSFWRKATPVWISPFSIIAALDDDE